MQAVYVLTMRHVLTPIVAVEEKLILRTVIVCVCGRRYPACNAQAPHCHLWPLRFCIIYPHYLINGTIFEKKKKKITEHKLCFDFLYYVCQKHSLF